MGGWAIVYHKRGGTEQTSLAVLTATLLDIAVRAKPDCKQPELVKHCLNFLKKWCCYSSSSISTTTVDFLPRQEHYFGSAECCLSSREFPLFLQGPLIRLLDEAVLSLEDTAEALNALVSVSTRLKIAGIR